MRPTDLERICKQDGCCVISECTMAPEDTIPKMLRTLQSLDPEGYEQLACPAVGFSALYSGDEYSEDAFDILLNALDELSPEGFRFGAHDDDPACLGFFPY
jgi:hypothetical protein